MAFPTSQTEKRGFWFAPIFDGLMPSKMAVHPCSVRSPTKNCVFRWAIKDICFIEQGTEEC